MKMRLTRNRINYKTIVVVHDSSGPPDLDKINAMKERARKVRAASVSTSPTTRTTDIKTREEKSSIKSQIKTIE